MKKIISLILVFTTCIFLLSGCGQINYEMNVKADGTITESVYLPLNEEYFKENGASSEQISLLKTQVIKMATNEAKTMINEWHTRVDENEELDELNKDYYKNGVTYGIYENTEVILVKLLFNDNIIRKEFYSIEEDTSETWTEKNFFTTKSLAKKTTNFAKARNGESLVKYYKEQFDLLLAYTIPTMVNKIPEPTLVYTYVTSIRRLHSDADSVYTQNGEYGTEYCHSWQISEDDLSKTITIYTVTANREIWYVVILGITLMATGVMFIVYFYKKKNKKAVND